MSIDAKTSDAKTSATPLQRTPLHALHLALDARMAPFAGYDMPLNYPTGVLKEHRHTRAAAGLFDVSHMGQIILRPKSGGMADAARAIERLVPADILGLAPGRQRYTFLTNDSGGILDDLMVSNRSDHYLLVVNAACKAQDLALLQDGLERDCNVEQLDRALIALQGPKAESALARLSPDCAGMQFMDVRELTILGTECVVARSGYTGEDGFEISLPASKADDFCGALLQNPAVAPIGLGARDSLRLEAGLCLYGNDIDTTTTPVAAALEWAVQKVRRNGGARAGGFPGADVILPEFDKGAARRRVGIAPEGRAPMRAGTELFLSEGDTSPVGHVTRAVLVRASTGPSPWATFPPRSSAPGTVLFAEVRGRRLPVAVATFPFVEHQYKRA